MLKSVLWKKGFTVPLVLGMSVPLFLNTQDVEMRLSFGLLFLCLLLPPSAVAGGVWTVGAAMDLAGYESRAGAVLGTYQPAPPDRSPETAARAANRFLGLLSEVQRRSAHHDLTSAERTRWTNAPVREDVGGIALGDLDETRIRAFSDLLAVLLSEKGYGKIRDVMLGDDLRATVNGRINAGVGIEAFRFSVFGLPSSTSRWAVQLDGHHVALNITLDGDALYMSPSFIGTYPQAFTVAGVELRPLAAETDLAHDLAASLTAEQRALAVISDRRGALRVGPGWDGVVPERVGIPGRLLNKVQREKLLALASQWFDLMPTDDARARKERFSDELDETWLAWSGPIAAGSDISYAIQGPSVIIEYANDARGGADAGNPVDHVHTIYREPDSDYGGGLRDRPRS